MRLPPKHPRLLLPASGNDSESLAPAARDLSGAVVTGTGKTLLSETLSREVACNLHTELAQNVKTPQHIHGSPPEIPDGTMI